MAARLMFSSSLCFWFMFNAIQFCLGARAENVLCPSSCSCLGNLVDCSNRGLNDVPTDMPRWVQILELQNNFITSLEEEAFEGLTNVEKIGLGNNQLRTLNTTIFQNLTSLKELHLQFNYFTEIPAFNNGANLTVLILHHNRIDSIDSEVLKTLPSLRTLNLHHNRITEIRNGTFVNGTKLQHLLLSSNGIVKLEMGCLDNLTQLETLRLSKNKLTTLPKDLFRQLKKLKILELSRNKISIIASLTFYGLDSLEVLKLQGNQITTLHDGAFWELSSMKQLRLDNNSIKVVAKGWLYGLTSLQQLSLRHNLITEIQVDSWSFCERLQELDLSYNYLQTLPKSAFLHLSKLQFLSLEHNNISIIEDGSFRVLTSLEILKLNNNEISWTIEDMMGAFAGLSSLRKLNLASNLIKSIAKHAFKGLHKLTELNLSNNSVTSIQNTSFIDLKSLKDLYLDTSSLLCDCQLQWFPGWLTDCGLQNMVSATCSHPELLKGKSVFDVNMEEFKCDDFPKPYFTEEPQNQSMLKGDNVSLTCKAASSSNSQMTFQWKKDNIVVHNANIENFAQQTSSDITVYTTIFHIYNVSDKDKGYYQCIISNHFGSAYSQKARINVQVFPTFTKTPVNLTQKAGTTARLECAAQGQPRPQIAWQKDGGDDFPAASERRMHVMPSDEVFFIVNLKASDMGTYSCTAQNTAGVIMANFTLTVLEVPSFVRPMEDKETRVGKTTALECMASGSPKPKVTWSKDEMPLAANERHFFTADNQLLVVVQTQPSDAGSYMCEMSNTLGTERGYSRLTVLPAHPGDDSMTGIIIIAVVCCVVGTSLVWVVIIYKTRKRHEEFMPTSSNDTSMPNEFVSYPTCLTSCPEEFKGCTQHLFSDDNSEHSSKDSGTGDSAKHSDENLMPSDLDGQGRPLLVNGGQRLAELTAGDSLGSLKGQNSTSSVDTLSSSPSTQTTTCGSRPRGLSDPTFRTFLPRPTNHDRMGTNDKLATMAVSTSATLCTASPKPGFRAIADGIRWIPTSCSTSSSGWQAHLSTGLSTCSSDDRHSDECVTTSSFSTFPRSASSLSHKSNSTSLQLTRPPQEVQNDSGNFSIASEDQTRNNNGVANKTVNKPRHPVPAPTLESSINHGKCSLPNLTYLEHTVPFYSSSFNKKDCSRPPSKV